MSPTERLRHYLSSLPTATAVASSVGTLIRILLYHTARATSSSHLLLGTSLTSLSISLISSISQGGGYAIREEMEEEWSSIRLIRPLRDIGIKECAALAWWSQLEVIGKEKPASLKQSIGGITEGPLFSLIVVNPLLIRGHIDFIMSLEQDYPSTVSTIVRTCNKLSPKTMSEQQCVICQR
jgi:cytoplasmic tRNA 2-thiolation protein 2